MRTTEILNALAYDAGLKIHATDTWTTVTTCYQPYVQCLSGTLFEAAFQLARLMIVHPDCPLQVKTALEIYDLHSRMLQQ